MKHIMIITSALMLLASHASAESDSLVEALDKLLAGGNALTKRLQDTEAAISGKMDCKVKSIKVMQIEEGLPKEFDSAIAWGGFDVGDKLDLAYLHLRGQFVLFIEDTSRNMMPLQMMMATTGVSAAETTAEIIPLPTNGFTIKGTRDKVFFHPDYIHAVKTTSLDLPQPPFKSFLRLQRYYKNDWQGIVTTTNPLSTLIYTLDCRHTVDELDKLLTILEETKQSQEIDAAYAKQIQDQEERQAKARDSIYQKQLEEAQTMLLEDALNAANKRIAELEAAQE